MDMVRSLWLALLSCCFLVTLAEAQVSPGPLSKPHTDLEGLRNCLKCHELGAGPSAKKCMACHKEIAVRIDEKRGLHHLAVTEKSQPCFACHGEHAGLNFDLIHWQDGRDAFDHREAGWPLEGKHAKIKCRDCHKKEMIVDKNLRKQQAEIDLDRTFLGLGQACLNCHFDEHRKQLDTNCSKCHNHAAFKPAPSFDHSKAKFALTGKHQKVECIKCHPLVADKKQKGKRATYAKYVGLEFKECSACHKDPHKGKFGKECQSCHQTSGFHEIRQGRFDHSKTNFPLKGKHASVTCVKCHGEGSKFEAKREHDKCSRCHKDIHKGQFAHRKDGGLCESCHDNNGFLPALFTTEDHQKTRFPLEGAHLAQPCISCHLEVQHADGDKYRIFVVEDRRCETCHEDIHFGQFTSKKPRKICVDCHKTTRWRDLLFEHDRDSTYPLEGEHRRVACSGCHKPVTEKGQTFVRYKPIDPSCKTCHTQEGLKLRAN